MAKSTNIMSVSGEHQTPDISRARNRYTKRKVLSSISKAQQYSRYFFLQNTVMGNSNLETSALQLLT